MLAIIKLLSLLVIVVVVVVAAAVYSNHPFHTLPIHFFHFQTICHLQLARKTSLHHLWSCRKNDRRRSALQFILVYLSVLWHRGLCP